MMNSRIFRSILVRIALVAGTLWALPAFPGTSPDELVKRATTDVITALEQTGDPKKLLQVAESKVSPHFDFTRMTRLAVGRGWQQASPEQRKALEHEFSELLMRTYSNALAAGAKTKMNLKVIPADVRPDAQEVTVKTQVAPAGRSPITINYQLAKTGDDWKVFDVMVDGISLVTNYRQVFSDEIAKSGTDGLIRLLTEKNKSLAEGRGQQKPPA